MAKNLKKWAGLAVASVLSLSMVVGLAACGGNGDDPINPNPDPTPTPDPQEPIVLNFSNASLPIGDKLTITATTDDDSAVTWTSSDPAVATVDANGVVTSLAEGSVTITATTVDDETATCSIVCGESFTYRAAVSTSPTTWNPHTWTNNTDSIILGYITMGFYSVQLRYDEAGNVVGYEWANEMASADPVDVTSEYVGRYGVASDDSNKAWRIALNQDAVWQNGDEITADDYIYSMQQLLDPVMLNRRSDSYTGSTFSIYGARNYLYSETAATYETLTSHGYSSIQAALNANEKVYVDAWTGWSMEGMVDASGNECPQWLAIDDTTLYRYLGGDENEDGAWVSGKDIYEGLLASAGESTMISYPLVSILVTNEHMDYEWNWRNDGNGGVGLLKVDDYTIDIILNDAIDDFYLRYNLSSNWLVHRETYEETKYTQGDLVGSRYNTGSVANTMSYGPYILTNFEFDQYFTLARNENWYGYTDGKHNGQYSTTNIDYVNVSGETAKAQMRELFMQGRLSDYTIDGTEWSTFGSSRYIMSEPEDYTYQFFLATDRSQNFLDSESTDTENHSVLGLRTFRKALSFAINRQSYITRFEPTAQVGLGLLNYLYIYNPDTGEAYRDTDAAKETILKAQDFYEEDGVWYDVHGEAYGSMEEAYDALTGFDLAYAADLMEDAYAEAIREDMYNDNQDVVITYTTVGSGISENLQALIDMINGMLADVIAACDRPTFKSVSLEVELLADESTYWARLQAGRMDLSFSGWGGSAMDPWGIIFSSYIDPANSNNYGFDSVAKGIEITINYNGTDVTASLYDWAAWLNNAQAGSAYDEDNLYEILGVAVGDADYDFKLEVLAQCELAQLQTYSNLPIFYSYVTSLRSAQYNNGSDYYVNNMIGFGGIRHVYYNYSDTQWTSFVASHNGNLESYYTAS